VEALLEQLQLQTAAEAAAASTVVVVASNHPAAGQVLAAVRRQGHGGLLVCSWAAGQAAAAVAAVVDWDQLLAGRYGAAGAAEQAAAVLGSNCVSTMARGSGAGSRTLAAPA
jgi:hypothetical protein